jgi:signal transduction histidine kinase
MNTLAANLKPYIAKRRLFFIIILLILSWLGAWRVDLYSQKEISKESIEGKIGLTSSLISSVSTLVDSTPVDSLKNVETIDRILTVLKHPLATNVLSDSDLSSLARSLQKIKPLIENPDKAKLELLNTIVENLEENEAVWIQIAFGEKWLYDSKGGKLTKFKADDFKEDVEPVEIGRDLPFDNLPLFLKGSAWQVNKIIPNKDNPEFYLRITQDYSPSGLSVFQGKYAAPAFLIFTFGLLAALISLYADRSLIGRIQSYVKELYNINNITSIPKIPKELKNRPDLIDLVTEIKKLRMQLQHKETQKKAVQRMAHEMQKPVDSVHSMSKEILEDESLSKHNRKNFKKIVELANEGSALMKTMLTLASLQAQYKLKESTIFNIDQIIEKKVNEYKKQNNRVGFVYSPSEAAANINGDRSLVQVAVDNLLRNAIAHGCIENNDNKIEVTTSVESQKVFVKISDNGEGLSHSRSSASRNSSDGSGHGLGLEMAKEIMRLHGGDCTLENKSRWWCGAVATITFPVANSPVDIFGDTLTSSYKSSKTALESTAANHSTERKSCNLNEIAKSVLDQYKEKITKYHIEINTIFDKTTNVCKDDLESERVRAAIDTLFMSAIAKRQKSSSVLLNGQQSNLKIETHARQSDVVFLFIDNGFGLLSTESLETIQIQELHYAQKVMSEHYDSHLEHTEHANGGTVTKMIFKKLNNHS